MKKLYSTYYLFFLFTLATTSVMAMVDEVSTVFQVDSKAETPDIHAVTYQDSISKPLPHTILKDNRKNKPKIFQDPVKTYDKRQLLFFTTFGFDDDYTQQVMDPGDLMIEAEKIISNFKVYPNPLYVNSQNLRISYNIKKNALVTVKMLDVLGNEVSTLFAQRVGAGTKTNEFNISSKVSGGFYFIRLSADSDHVTRKISVVQ